MKYVFCHNIVSNFFISFLASPCGLFPGDLPDHRTDAIRSPQNHCFATTFKFRSHQSFPLPDIKRSQVPSFCQNHASRYKAWKSFGQLKLCTENMRFRASQV